MFLGTARVCRTCLREWAETARPSDSLRAESSWGLAPSTWSVRETGSVRLT